MKVESTAVAQVWIPLCHILDFAVLWVSNQLDPGWGCQSAWGVTPYISQFHGHQTNLIKEIARFHGYRTNIIKRGEYRGEAEDAGLGRGVVLEREGGRLGLVDQIGVEDVELVALRTNSTVSAMPERAFCLLTSF